MAKKIIIFIFTTTIILITSKIFLNFFQIKTSTQYKQTPPTPDNNNIISGLNIKTPAGWTVTSNTPQRLTITSQSPRHIQITITPKINFTYANIEKQKNDLNDPNQSPPPLRQHNLSQLIKKNTYANTNNQDNQATTMTLNLYQDKSMNAEIIDKQMSFTIAYQAKIPKETDQNIFEQLLSQITLNQEQYPIKTELTQTLSCNMLNQITINCQLKDPEDEIPVEIQFYSRNKNSVQILDHKKAQNRNSFDISWQNSSENDKKEKQDVHIFAEIMKPQELIITKDSQVLPSSTSSIPLP